MNAKDLVLRATAELFGTRDAGAVDRWWGDGYVEHSTIGGEGLDGLRRAASQLPGDFRHDKARVLGEGDLVVVHGVYHGLGPDPIAGCDLWRVVDDRITEHWDAHQEFVASNPSGHSMTDGPSVVTEPEKTAANKAVVTSFVELIMMDGGRDQLPRFFDGDRFVQHNPVIADGVSGLGAAIQSGVWAAVVEKAHRVVADGEFVFTQGEGTLAGAPSAFYDIFRVENGKLAEHWDVVFARPAGMPHGNGLF